jgi:sRNA-binding protein
VAELEQRLEYLNRKKASIQNPYLPRPEPTPEDRAAEEGLDGAARIVRAEEQISQARQDLEEARRAVERARAEAEQALAPPDATGWGNTTN